MRYRRSDTTDPESSRWRLAYRGDLLECGVPVEVVDNDRRWTYLLLHGDDGRDTAWTVDWISKQQATQLLKLLETKLGDGVGYELLRHLRWRIEQVERFPGE